MRGDVKLYDFGATLFIMFVVGLIIVASNPNAPVIKTDISYDDQPRSSTRLEAKFDIGKGCEAIQLLSTYQTKHEASIDYTSNQSLDIRSDLVTQLKRRILDEMKKKESTNFSQAVSISASATIKGCEKVRTCRVIETVRTGKITFTRQEDRATAFANFEFPVSMTLKCDDPVVVG